MPRKKPHTIRALTNAEVPSINENLDILFSHKPESRYLWDRSASSVKVHLHQHIEHGQAYFSGTGSATVARTFSLGETHPTFIYANAHALSPLVIAHVTDVTQTAITITCRTVSGTGNFSAVTSASILVNWQIVGSSP